MIRKHIFTLILILCLIQFITNLSFRLRHLPQTSPSPSPPPFNPSTTAPLITVKVTRVIDGDTFEIDTGQKVRLIGINSPEVAPGHQQCFGQNAHEFTRQLIEGRSVTLVTDISETDKYGRLLRYVYLNDLFINEHLVKQGYAQAAAYPPDIHHQDLFNLAQQNAQTNNRGLWSSCRNVKGITSTPTLSDTNIYFICDCSRSCAQLSSCAEAQFQLLNCGCSARDGNHNGLACDSAPLHCHQ